MHRSRAVVRALLVSTAIAAVPGTVLAQAKQLALVVGINGYDHSKFRNLEFAENDANELARLLTRNNYEVTLLTGEAATLQSVQAAIKKLTQRRNRHEMVILALAGHGLFFPDKNGSYFCPKDAEPADPATMLPLSGVYQGLADCGAGAKLLLVDACREEAVRGVPRTRGVDNALQAPEGVGVLYSCSPGQFAFESASYKHGVFFYHVLEALRGKAREENGDITWDLLRAYVKRQVSRDVAKQFPGGKQVPNEVSNLSEIPPLLRGVSIPALPPMTRTLIIPNVPVVPKLVGRWSGTSQFRKDDAWVTIRFEMTVVQQGERVTGAIKEVNTFAKPGEPWLHATVVGKFDERTNKVTFIKTYDGTAGADHDLQYAGSLSADGTRIDGRWQTVPEWNGPFSLRRLAADAPPLRP